MKKSVIVGIGVIIPVIIIGIVISQGNYVIVAPSYVSPEENISESSQNSADSKESQELISMLEDKRKFDFETHDYVRFYPGKDGTGVSIVDILNSRMYENYPDIEQITMNPHRVEWYNYVDEEKGENFVVVGYAFETFKEKSEYVWEVDKTTKIITAKNSAAQELLDIVNSEN